MKSGLALVGVVSCCVWFISAAIALSEWGDARRHRKWVPEAPRLRARWALVALFLGWGFLPVVLLAIGLLIGSVLVALALCVVVLLVGGVLALPYKLWKDAFGKPPGPPRTALDESLAEPGGGPAADAEPAAKPADGRAA